MITVEADQVRVESRLTGGGIACPDCSTALRSWGWARTRGVRGLPGRLRPRRARCPGCLVTHVLLPVTVLVRRAYAVEVIGAALVARAGGSGHRPIGIGMAETAHGANTTTSSAGARGLMQFMPATFAAYGVDGDGDGLADIAGDADSVHSAANYLTASGVHRGEQGVRDALFAYNHTDWYVNDVLFYAHAYGGGLVLGDPLHCDGQGGNPDLPPVDSERVAQMLAFAAAQKGDAYILGAGGPDAWDCSSLTQTAMAQIGITSPRTAQAQRDWLAMGNGFRVPVDQAQPGDLFFFDSYLGPHTIGHVGFVWDPAAYTSIEAANPTKGVGFLSYEYALDNNIFEIWRLGNIDDNPKAPG